MDIPVKTLKNGFQMPVLGLGTWQMGGRHERDPNNNDEADIRAIRAAIDLGLTEIDTAEQYANGYSEELLGRAIKDIARSKLFLMSKVMAIHMKYDDLIEACRKSLDRVGTSYFDMYLLHRVPPGSMEEAVKALDDLMSEGLIKRIGVANFGIDSLRRVQGFTKHSISYDQVHYNLEFREPERAGLLDYCQSNDILLAAWRPVQKGALLTNPPAILTELCIKYQKTPAQIAINWVLCQKNVVTLVKSSNVEHLKENLGALGWQMDPEDVELVRREYPNQKSVSDAVPLDAQ